MNLELNRQATGAIDNIWNTEGQDLRKKFFYLDHTAEVLENYRRVKENEIFQFILHGEREKKAFLKKEGRKLENLIENYDQNFQGYKYFQSTDTSLALEDLSASPSSFLEYQNLGNIDAALNKIESDKKPASAGLLNEHKQYQLKHKEMQNLRIEKMLKPRTNNPELQKYLEEKSNYETASLGETSADELAIKTQTSDVDSDKRVDIYRDSRIANHFDRVKELAAEVENYENKIVEQHRYLDINRAKGKNYVQISFNDLTVQENLNYIKFNLKTSNQAFEMFEIIKDKMENHPEIPASIVQKLALRSNLRSEDINAKLLQRFEYKNILRGISKNIDMLDNKNLVDTVFAIGKLHRKHNYAEI